MTKHQTDAMQTPELLLKDLNRYMLELKSALQVLEDPALDDSMTPIMRRLLLAEVLGNEWIIAIGGSQGAGKTTLLKTIYSMEGADADWLTPNEGRGEKLPILIVEEEGRTSIQGAVRQLSSEPGKTTAVTEIELTAREFQLAASDPQPSHLLPILKVPRRYLTRPNQAWLLLPGYEQLDPSNKDWQQLMRQALVGAAGCVIVTDETRMANQHQLEIAKDMLSSELLGAASLVLVSKTESMRDAPDKQLATKLRAGEIFGVSKDRIDKWVMCIGADDKKYIESWLPKFSALARDMSYNGGSNRAEQLAKLEQVLRKDLTAFIAKIKTKSQIFFQQRDGGDSGSKAVIQNCLAAFDDQCEELRVKYHRAITKQFGEQFDKALKALKDRLVSDHEGIFNHIRDWIRTSTESQRIVEWAIKNSWDDGGDILQRNGLAIEPITKLALGYSRAPALSVDMQVTDEKDALSELNPQQEIWKRPTPQETAALRTLLSGAEGQNASNKIAALDSAASLLPALSLEYSRIASLSPGIVGVDPSTAEVAAASSRPDIIASAFSNLGTGLSLGQNVLRGIAAALALDVAIDGELDVTEVLRSVLVGNAEPTGSSGQAATAAASGVVTGFGAAVIATVAIGYLVHSAMTEVKTHDAKASAIAESMLHAIKDRHITHFMQHFDDIMKTTRDRMKVSLRSRYRLDQTLMDQDRLAKSIADVRSYQQQLLGELDLTGQSLRLFSQVQ